MIIVIIGLVVLGFLWCCCIVSGYHSKKEEQEQAVNRLKGKEYMLDDYNIEDDFTYDETFVKKDGKNE